MDTTNTSTSSSLFDWLRHVVSTRSTYCSDRLYLRRLGTEFLSKLDDSSSEDNFLPNPVATAVASYLYQEFNRIHPLYKTNRMDSMICTEDLINSIYSDRLTFSSFDEATPLDFISLTPYYTIVEKLAESIESYESEYEQFQLEFDEVKEMIQRSRRVIGRALKRWEDFFLRITLRHWRFQVKEKRRMNRCRRKIGTYYSLSRSFYQRCCLLQDSIPYSHRAPPQKTN